MIKKKVLITFVVLLLMSCASKLNSGSALFIRLNQVGFLEEDTKTAVVLTDDDLENYDFTIYNLNTNKKVFEGKVKGNTGIYGNFKNSHKIDFSKVVETGIYFIEINGVKSYEFKIGDDIYNSIVNSLLKFFRVQRCGYTNPELHEVCHPYDATSIIENGKKINHKIDLTGGWHDAGDYVKFLNTTAYATYMLLFSYEFDNNKFGFDGNKDGVPDILEEAKIGLDWLLRCNYEKFKLITQVQDLKDHDVGLRLPENDTLKIDRPAFSGMGKNLVGIYSAVMALGSRIWRQKFQLDDFADKCLNAAENLYSIRSIAPDVDTSGTGAYRDNAYLGKLGLGAIEMYLTTNRDQYLADAKEYAASAGADYWWSYGDLSSLAHYRLSKIDTAFIEFIKTSLEHYKRNSEKKLFEEPVSFKWGTNNTLLGVLLKSQLYEKLTGDKSYRALGTSQRDYVLGKNPWGICFLTGFGKTYSKSLHHQISILKKKELPGGFAAGPVSKDIVRNYNINYSRVDRFYRFQSDSAYYRDEAMDYVTNEPTIVGNATAIFVMGNLSK